MPDHEDSLGGETLDGDVKADRAEQSLGDGSTLGGGDTSSLSDTTDGEGENLAAGLPVIDLGKRFEIESELGKGGMGAVQLARDRSLGRQVAIKRILETKNRSSAAINRFITEAKSIATLNHHNIVQIHEFGQDDDGPLIVFEYVSGGSLLDRLKKGKLDPEEAISITCQLCDALTIAHGKGIIHRDIKPANVLLTEDGVPKLTDFGLAKQQNTDHGQTAVGAIMGTLDFMPPEQRRDSSSVDERSDLWSLAAVSYQMLTGNNPRVIRLDKLPTNIARVLGRMLEEDPAERFASAVEFKEAFLQAATSGLNASKNLGEGECPSCGTNNPSNRKWCRNSECAESLLTKCLGCNNDIAVWDEICGECGGRQSELRQKAAAEEAVILAGDPITNMLDMTFNMIHAGTFTMGSRESEEDRGDDEHQHKVTISKSFFMQTTEVTQSEWKAVMDTEPWKGKDNVVQGTNYPASFVTWDDAAKFCKKLSEKEGKTYRLPTEAEWEYACRAGTQTTWSFGDDEKELGDYAWSKENASDIGEKYAHQVGLKKPNAFGLYDMHGNVYEWCHDYYGEDYYKQSPEQDPRGLASGDYFNDPRVLRGGSWLYNTRVSRSARRGRDVPYRRCDRVGFRLVRELD